MKILKQENYGKSKLSIDVEIELINGKLPNKNIITKISNYIVNKNEGYHSYFICFYLPGMKLDAGAFATTYHNLTIKVNIQNFILNNYPEYSKLL